MVSLFSLQTLLARLPWIMSLFYSYLVNSELLSILYNIVHKFFFCSSEYSLRTLIIDRRGYMRDLLCKEVYPHFFAKVMRDLLQADGNSIASYTVYCTICTVKKHYLHFGRCCNGLVQCKLYRSIYLYKYRILLNPFFTIRKRRMCSFMYKTILSYFDTEKPEENV